MRVLLPDEVQPLTAAQQDKKPSPEAAAVTGTPSGRPRAGDGPGPATDGERNRPQATAGAPQHKADRQPTTARPQQTGAPVPARPTPPQGPAPRPGSSSRVRARLARLGVQRSSPYNPVLEPLLRIVRGNDPKADAATLRQIERAYQVAERWHRGQKRKSGDPYITHPSPSPRSSPSWAWIRPP